MIRARLAFALIASLALAAVAPAQSPVQWKGNARAAIEDAQAQSLPLMFWVSERQDWDDDDLRDAQERAFRDPIVVWLSRSRFIPVRVTRSSNVIKAAEEFGLPTTHGLYIAVLSPSGKVLAEISPDDVSNPETLATRLMSSFNAYRSDVYESKVKPVLDNPESTVPQLREAMSTVWRLGIRAADEHVVKLLERPNLTPTQRAKLYSMLASLATKPCIDRLLAAAPTDKDAQRALRGAETGALKFLLSEIPAPDPAQGSVKDPGPGLNDRQFAAYTAACAVARAGEPRPRAFWEKSPARRQAEELADCRRKAEAVLSYWEEGEGKYR